jgi:hypothetical protein
VDVMDNKNKPIMNEGMFSQIDQIRQDSKDVRDFVKKVFADREFKKMSTDKEFIKYLKSIYEGTMIDEEYVKFSNRTQNGTITTGSVQTTNELVVKEDKNQIKDLVKKVKHEKLFYDVLVTMEKKYGKNKYRIWLEKSLKDFGVNPKHYDYRTNGAAEEKLFQLGRK